MEVTLKSTNVGMPVSVHDRHAVGVDHYLIKPFDMKLTLDSVEKVNADLTMLLDITPAIYASFDAHKIVRVADIFAIVQRSFDVQEKVSYVPSHIPIVPIHEVLHLLTYSLTYLLTHSLTHSLTRYYMNQ